LFINGFERLPEASRVELGRVARTLVDQHNRRLCLVFKGAEKLCDLKYQNGASSLLNIAADIRWPELSRADFKALATFFDQGLLLSDKETKDMLAESGGHPSLARACLELRSDNAGLTAADYRAALGESEAAAALFADLPLRNEYAVALKSAIESEDIGPAAFFLRDPLQRWSYWRNLVAWTPRGVTGRLRWRCEAIRGAGREALANGG